MSTFLDFFKRKQVEPPQLVPGIAGVRDMTYQNDVAGNHFYMFDTNYLKSNFLNLRMDTIAGKTQALNTVTPFATMIERMSLLFAAGTDYVTDMENNENFNSPFFDSVRNLIAHPNPLQTSAMFKKQVETYLLAYGFCPIFGLRLSQNDIPSTLWCIPPDMFRAKMTGNFLYQTDISELISEAYIQTGYKRRELDPADYFIVFKGRVNVGEDGDMTVSTPVDTLSITVNNWINQAIARGAIIKDGGPKGIITSDNISDFGMPSMTQKEQQRLNEAFKSKYGWVDKEFKVMVSQAALRWQAMSWNANELMLDATLEATMKDICFTLGWPYGLFNPSSQYSNNVAGEEKRAYTTVIIPDSQTYAQSLTKFLNIDDLRYYIDYTDVEALQKDKKQDAEAFQITINALNAAFNTSGITKKEYRTALSLVMDINPEDLDIEKETVLAQEIGVGGTQSMISIITDQYMTVEQKRGTLKVLFNLDDEQVATMIPEPTEIEQPQITSPINESLVTESDIDSV